MKKKVMLNLCCSLFTIFNSFIFFASLFDSVEGGIITCFIPLALIYILHFLLRKIYFKTQKHYINLLELIVILVGYYSSILVTLMSISGDWGGILLAPLIMLSILIFSMLIGYIGSNRFNISPITSSLMNTITMGLANLFAIINSNNFYDLSHQLFAIFIFIGVQMLFIYFLTYVFGKIGQRKLKSN